MINEPRHDVERAKIIIYTDSTERDIHYKKLMSSKNINYEIYNI